MIASICRELQVSVGLNHGLCPSQQLNSLCNLWHDHHLATRDMAPSLLDIRVETFGSPQVGILHNLGSTEPVTGPACSLVITRATAALHVVPAFLDFELVALLVTCGGHSIRDIVRVEWECLVNVIDHVAYQWTNREYRGALFQDKFSAIYSGARV